MAGETPCIPRILLSLSVASQWWIGNTRTVFDPSSTQILSWIQDNFRVTFSWWFGNNRTNSRLFRIRISSLKSSVARWNNWPHTSLYKGGGAFSSGFQCEMNCIGSELFAKIGPGKFQVATDGTLNKLFSCGYFTKFLPPPAAEPRSSNSTIPVHNGMSDYDGCLLYREGAIFRFLIKMPHIPDCNEVIVPRMVQLPKRNGLRKWYPRYTHRFYQQPTLSFTQPANQQGQVVRFAFARFLGILIII